MLYREDRRKKERKWKKKLLAISVGIVKEDGVLIALQFYSSPLKIFQGYLL